MARRTQREVEKTEGVKLLREQLKPGDTIYTILRHVTSSGMSREVGLLLGEVRCSNCRSPYYADGCPKGCQGLPGLHAAIHLRDLNHLVAWSLGLREGRHDGVVMHGVGTNSGFALVYELSQLLWPDGFGCVGPRCPSQDHWQGPDQTNFRPHVEGGQVLCVACEDVWPCDVARQPNRYRVSARRAHVADSGPRGRHWHTDGHNALKHEWL